MPPLFIFIFNYIVMLYRINYIYYEVLKIHKRFNEAEPALEFNHSMFMIRLKVNN